MEKFDHIIVGQGLAGACLSLQLIDRGKRIIVFDQPKENRASAVAAGLYNPITGKRMSQSWKSGELFPYLHEFYQRAEVELKQKFLHTKPIYRPFVSVEEQNEWMALSTGSLEQFIKNILTSASFAEVNDPFGGVLTRQSGYLDVNSFMKAVRDRLKGLGLFREYYFDWQQLQMNGELLSYEDVAAPSIIFCEGTDVAKNPFFNWMPIRPLKGETLTITANLTTEIIFNRGVYLVPGEEDHSFTVGATYRPNDSSNEITPAGKAELMEKLHDLLQVPFETGHQNWGIRPTTPDRRPILGTHPKHKNMIVFNGLGTKGVSLAPYFSRVLADHLEGKGEIPQEVNIERFKALYWGLSSH